MSLFLMWVYDLWLVQGLWKQIRVTMENQINIYYINKPSMKLCYLWLLLGGGKTYVICNMSVSEFLASFYSLRSNIVHSTAMHYRDWILKPNIKSR